MAADFNPTLRPDTMQETINRLTHQYEEAKRTKEWCLKERAELEIKMKRANRDMYHAQDQLKQLTQPDIATWKTQ